MTKTYYLFIFILLLVACSIQENDHSNKTSLNQNWSFYEEGSPKSYPAEVPGNVHMDLYNAHLIEDPFYRSNEDSLKWIAEKNWVYESYFEVDDSIIQNEHIYLVFEGLDTHAEVFVNDSLILSANNMFRKWKIDIKSFLKRNNTLKVNFKSPHQYIEEQAHKLNYDLPESRVFSRKAPYQFGWDWGPEFVSMGIWKEVYLESWNELKFEDIYYATDSIVNNEAYLSAHLNIISDKETEVQLIINHKSSSFLEESLNLKKGINTFSYPIKINKPKLWWSNGLGEPFLYELEATLLNKGNKSISIKKKLGIRTIELIRKKDEWGTSFYFELNGIPVFMKGANYIPQDNFLNRVSHEKYVNLIQSTVDANMNMLRVWGGGIYENDEFYNLCDENGILVWQDFMFACAMYPGDSSFLENVKQEAIDNIIRLRNHPSIALWCGNNEIDEAWNNWGWQKQFNYSDKQQSEIWKSYTDLFHEQIPKLIKTYDPGRDYWASSPSIGWGHPESLTEGDSHYWGVWWGEQTFEVYKEKVGRFMSEYGFQGFPDPSTLDSVLLIDDLNLKSSILKTHQKHPRGFELIQAYMERDYNTPNDFQDYNYISQILQAEGIKVAIEAHRRAKPYCMGTLYWQLNDCWPVVSWSSLDYYGNWKALHYQAKRSFEEVLISVKQEQDSLNFFIVSDLLEELNGELHLELMNFSGELLYKHIVDVKVPQNSSQPYFQKAIIDLIDIANKNKLVLSVKLKSEEHITMEALHFFEKVKHLELENPTIQSSVKKLEDGYEISLSTDKLAKNIQLSIQGEPIKFSDNFFDLLPKQTKVIYFKSERDLNNISDNLKIKSLFDTRNP